MIEAITNEATAFIEQRWEDYTAEQHAVWKILFNRRMGQLKEAGSKVFCEGIERIAFTAVDSADGAEEIRARGYVPLGPTDFERPVTMPNGMLSAAKFRTFQWPVAEAPGGVRIFACQHKTRETVWIPELMKHANGAKRLRQVLIATQEPAKAAAHMSRLIDRETRNESAIPKYQSRDCRSVAAPGL